MSFYVSGGVDNDGAVHRVTQEGEQGENVRNNAALQANGAAHLHVESRGEEGEERWKSTFILRAWSVGVFPLLGTARSRRQLHVARREIVRL